MCWLWSPGTTWQAQPRAENRRSRDESLQLERAGGEPRLAKGPSGMKRLESLLAESHGHATEPGPGEGTQESPIPMGERLGVQRGRGGYQGALTVATGKLSVSEASFPVQCCELEQEMEDQAQRPRSPAPAPPPRYCWVTIFFEPLLAGVQSIVLRKGPLLDQRREPGTSPEQAGLSSPTTELTSLFLRLDEWWQRPGEPRQEAGGGGPTSPRTLGPFLGGGGHWRKGAQREKCQDSSTGSRSSQGSLPQLPKLNGGEGWRPQAATAGGKRQPG